MGNARRQNWVRLGVRRPTDQSGQQVILLGGMVGCRYVPDCGTATPIHWSRRVQQARFSYHNMSHPVFTRVNIRTAVVQKNGVTLVELLVVMSIVGVLISLLLPAVQAAREAARKIQCQNNLKQVGLATQNYHDALKSLPTGCLQWRPFRGNPRLKNLAWSALLLPYMEQGNVHKLVNFDYAFDHPINDVAGKTPIPVYLCPSVPPKNTLRARSDYGGIYGQRITSSTNTDNGVLIYNRPIRFREILDGITNTMQVAEDCGGNDGEWINGNNVFEVSAGINDPKAWQFDDEIRSKHTGGAMVLYCCGRTQYLSNSTDLKVLAAMVTREFGDNWQQE
jgi:prepilin-type N-terminal cleavage/methylation domain-containing protein